MIDQCRMCGSTDVRFAAEIGGYDYFECETCGFAFAPAAFEQDLVGELYSSGRRGVAEGAPSLGWADAEFLEPALQRLPGDVPLTILDFGAGDSEAPNLLRERGHRVRAVDVSPPLRPHPDRLTGELSSLRLPRNSFDLVYSFQTFEHLDEPATVLGELLGLVRPGGLALIHTDVETPERQAGLAEWWYVMPPNHCSLFRVRTFQRYQEPTPHEVVWESPKSVIIQV